LPRGRISVYTKHPPRRMGFLARPGLSDTAWEGHPAEYRLGQNCSPSPHNSHPKTRESL